MITCDVLGIGPANGGLGNQMFCIATALALAKRNNTSAYFSDLNLNHYRYYGNTIFHDLNKTGDDNLITEVYREPSYTSTIFNKIPYKDNMRISGHFQSYKYFNDCRDFIIEKFKVPDTIDRKIIIDYFPLLKGNCTSIHVRRGDYLKFKGHYDCLGIDYYEKSLNLINNVGKVFVFSDDIGWCKKNIKFKKYNDLFFVEGQTDVEDLWLMTKMNNNIIANSTFSWWGAYLNQTKGKTIVRPSKWFGPNRTKNNKLETKDLFPEKWITI